MPVPIDYRQASADFDRFLLDLSDALDMSTTHQAWGALLGVFDTFRRRLEPEDVLDFAKALPPLLGATFIQDWQRGKNSPAFASRDVLDLEVMAYHRDHGSPSPAALPRRLRRSGSTSIGSGF